MEKEFVTYELSLRLKELGFDEPCMAVYFGNGENELFTFSPLIATENTIRMVELGHIPCPTYSQAFRFFREKYGLDHEISYAGKPGEYRAFVKEYVYGNNGNNPSVFTYEGAEEICLEKLIEIVENEKTL